MKKQNDVIQNKILAFFESLSDKTRLKILLSIAQEPKTVNEIYEFVGKDKMTLSAISHQLKTLSNLEIVVNKKQGKEKFYELSDKYCWCILKDVYKQFGEKLKIKCKKCSC